MPKRGVTHKLKPVHGAGTDLSWPLKHEAIPLRWNILAKPYPPALRAQADLVYLSIASKTAVRCVLPCAVCCIQTEHCSHTSTTVMLVGCKVGLWVHFALIAAV